MSIVVIEVQKDYEQILLNQKKVNKIIEEYLKNNKKVNTKKEV